MAKAHCIALSTTGGEVDQGARHGRCRGDGHRGRAHHRVVQLAHRHGAGIEVDVAGVDLLVAAGQVVLRRRDEGDLGRVLALERLFRCLDQAHAQRAGNADGLELCQRRLVIVDGRLQLGTGVADVLRVDEHRGDASGDHRRLQLAHAGHIKLIDQVAGGEHRATTLAFALIGRVDELQHDLGGREGDTVQFEVTGFLHLTVADGHVGDDGLVDVGLPDAHRADAVLRDACRIDVASVQRERASTGGQVAAVAGPVDEVGIDRHLPVQVIHVVIGLAAGRDDHALAGTGGSAAHAIGVLGIGIGRTDHPLQQVITGHAGLLRAGRQVFQAEEHALGGAAAHIGGRDFDLGDVGHGVGSLGLLLCGVRAFPLSPTPLPRGERGFGLRERWQCCNSRHLLLPPLPRGERGFGLRELEHCCRAH